MNGDTPKWNWRDLVNQVIAGLIIALLGALVGTLWHLSNQLAALTARVNDLEHPHHHMHNNEAGVPQ